MTNFSLIDGLRGIVMRGPNVTESCSFFENLWGLRLSHSENDEVFFRGNGSEPIAYGLIDHPVFGIEYIHFSTKDRSSMNALFKQLVKQNCTIISQPGEFNDFAGGYGFEILDPDNRRLRFRTDALKLTNNKKWGYPDKVSHVVLNTPDMELLQDFFTSVLGFRVSDYSGDQMVFLRCNNEHHTIALSRSNYPSVNHVAFDLSSIDEFMHSIGRMKQAGHNVSWGPGRHGPGNNPFAYYVSPPGFVVEFTTELQIINEKKHQPKVWSRDDPASMDLWMTAGPPSTAQRTAMQGRPDPGFPNQTNSKGK